MPTKIITKNGSGAPDAADLEQGELAVDLTNKRLYTEDSGGSVIEVGSNPSALSIAGTAVTATATELNVLDGITSTTAELNILDGVTADATEINTLDGITATTTELNYTDGVTSNIQTQLNAKAPIDAATFTGTTTIPTADINGGTIDGTTIGGSTPAAGSFTTVSATGDVDIADKIVHTGDTNTAIRFPAADTVAFETGGTERMRIDSSGNLLVGTTTAAAGTAHQFENSSAAPSLLVTKNSAFTARVPLGVHHTATSGDNMFVEFYTEASLTGRGDIDYNRAAGLVRYNTTSDYRAKDIIGPVTDSGKVIDALKVYEGKMKGATQSRPMLIAHEAQEVVPYAVSGIKDQIKEDGTPKYQSMDVSSVVPLLLAEIQDLRKRIAILESN